MALSEVQEKTAVSSGFATSIAATFDTGATAGNLLIGQHFTRGDASTEPGTWTTAVDIIDAIQDDNGQIAYLASAVGGETTITFTGPSGADTQALHIREWNDSAGGTWQADVTATSGPQDDVNTQSTGTTGTTGQAEAVAFGQVQLREATNSTGASWTNTFTGDQELSGGEAGEWGTLWTCHKILSSTGTQETTASGIDSISANRTMGGIAVFYSVAGGGVSVTPSTASLTLATFAPTVSVSDNQSVEPSTATLTTSGFAPTVSTTANVTVTPSVLAFTLSVFAPDVSINSDPLITDVAPSTFSSGSTVTITGVRL